MYRVFDHHAHAGTSDGRCSWPTVIPAFEASKRSTLNRLREERCHSPWQRKRYGLPLSMVERALLEVYQTVVLDQQRYRDHS
jgi:hypothetical protein